MKLSQLLQIGVVIFSFTQIASASNAGESELPFLSGGLTQTEMLAPSPIKSPAHQTYILPATPATSQWGVFDSNQPTVLTIKSGDTVVVETLTASDNQVIPGATIAQIQQIQGEVAGRGPHTLTGPVYVEGAEPGDVLKIHFNKIVPRPYASNNTMPGKGLFPKELPTPQVKYFYLDVKNKKMQFAPGIVVPLAPFPGVIAVERKEPGKYDSAPPGPFGGNMDLREMTEGTTLYLPVFVKGGRVWTGDSHAGQGNGEIDLTAIETAFAEFSMTIDLVKGKSLTWPRIETPTHWIAVGYDQDLNKALDILKTETIKLIMDERHVNQPAAEKIMMQTWNCPISEVVNGVQGMYCLLPKQKNVGVYKLPTADNAQFYVTYAKDNDIENAMRKASMTMLDKIVAEKKLSKMDAYVLASFTLDCRVAPYQTGEKEVHCMLPKNLWTQHK